METWVWIRDGNGNRSEVNECGGNVIVRGSLVDRHERITPIVPRTDTGLLAIGGVVVVGGDRLSADTLERVFIACTHEAYRISTSRQQQLTQRYEAKHRLHVVLSSVSQLPNRSAQYDVSGGGSPRWVPTMTVRSYPCVRPRFAHFPFSMPPLTVCFDALGTCFSLDPLVRAVDELLGERLATAGQGARTVVYDWVSEGHGE